MTLNCEMIDLSGKQRVVRALIDPGSEKSFMREASVKDMELEALPSVDLTIEGLYGTRMSQGKVQVREIKLRNKVEKQNIQIPVVVVPEICKPIKKVSRGPWMNQLSELGIDLSLEQQRFPKETAEMDILLGADGYHKILEDRTIKTCGPVAIKTTLGWVVCGPAKSQTSENVARVMFVQTNTEERTDEIVKAFWSLETMGIQNNEETLKQASFD